MKFSIYTFVFYMMYFKFSGTYKITKRMESGCRSVVSDSVTPKDCRPWNSPGHNTEVCSRFLLQRIFPT